MVAISLVLLPGLETCSFSITTTRKSAHACAKLIYAWE